MSLRALVIFLSAWVLIRISGRRSFGLKTPLDIIISILLGALLSRAVCGVSPFVPVMSATFVLVLMHRLLGRIATYSSSIEHFINGDRLLLYSNGKFIYKNMRRALLTREDIQTGVRKALQQDDLQGILMIYMEKTGEIGIVKKDDGRKIDI